MRLIVLAAVSAQVSEAEARMGCLFDHKQSFPTFDVAREMLSPAGSKLLVLWVDDRMQQARYGP